MTQHLLDKNWIDSILWNFLGIPLGVNFLIGLGW